MSGLINILLVVLILTGIALLFYAIIALKRITDTIESLKTDIHQLTERTITIFGRLELLNDQLLNIVTDINHQLSAGKYIVSNIKDLVDDVVNFKSKLLGTVELPVQNINKKINAISHGVSAFLSALKK
jgi:uncharacterized protein YoxC